MAILSFADSATLEFYVQGHTKRKIGWGNITRIVRRKLDMLNYAGRLSDLRSPPGNKLEALTADLRGLYSVRVNDQWRIVFRWTDSGPAEVRVMDYH